MKQPLVSWTLALAALAGPASDALSAEPGTAPAIDQACMAIKSSDLHRRGEDGFEGFARELDDFLASPPIRFDALQLPEGQDVLLANPDTLGLEMQASACGAHWSEAGNGPAATGGSIPGRLQSAAGGTTATFLSCRADSDRAVTFLKGADGNWQLTRYAVSRVGSCDPE